MEKKLDSKDVCSQWKWHTLKYTAKIPTPTETRITIVMFIRQTRH